MKLCDVTQFYSPTGGGVRRYLGEKVRFILEETPDQHVLIVPGEDDACTGNGRARIYTIRSPLISRTSRYRVLLRLEAVERVIEREEPDLLESGDPYQLAWKAIHSGAAFGIPVVGFYHSHFPEAYLRSVEKFLGRALTEYCLDLSKRYIRTLYNRFERTLVPSPALGEVLAAWGVRNVFHNDLGVDPRTFQPAPLPGENVRGQLGVRPEQTLLLYVGRLAPEKNTQTLFAAFRRLAHRFPARFHLVVAGDGLQRGLLQELQTETGNVTWYPRAETDRLAALYRAADLFVHPGVQETFGLVTLEAQACGTPVIGIRGSYMDRIIHHDQTLWARENSPAALAAAIAQSAAAGLKSDPADLHRRVAEQYSWTHIFSRLFDLYRKVIADYRRP